MKHPVDNIQWVDVDLLQANDYNPNHVYNQELKLLELSILTNGWIQPILVTQNYVIIDGFHRAHLAKTSEKIRTLTGGKVPCCIMNLSEPERMLLTIRINRAKGSHIAIRMHDVISKLVKDHEISIDEICKGIGATKDEVELLLMEDVFEKLDVKNHEYSKAWYPA